MQLFIGGFRDLWPARQPPRPEMKRRTSGNALRPRFLNEWNHALSIVDSASRAFFAPDLRRLLGQAHDQRREHEATRSEPEGASEHRQHEEGGVQFEMAQLREHGSDQELDGGDDASAYREEDDRLGGGANQEESACYRQPHQR